MLSKNVDLTNTNQQQIQELKRYPKKKKNYFYNKFIINLLINNINILFLQYLYFIFICEKSDK